MTQSLSTQWSKTQWRGQRGSVTAEAAIALPVMALFVLALIWMISLGVAQLRAVDSARDVARAVARGDAPGRAVEVGMRQAPSGTAITVTRNGDEVTAEVTVQSRPPRWLPVPLPSVALHAAASIPDEAVEQ